MSKHFSDITLKQLPNSEVEITGVITSEFVAECRKEAIKELNNKVNFPGFRPGHIPEDTLVKRLGEGAVLEEAAEIALGREFPSVMKESGAFPIGRPTISIMKIAPGSPLEFKITTAVEPNFVLPDYKNLAKSVKLEKVEAATEKEIEDVKEEIKKQNLKPDLKEGEVLEDKIKENLLKEKEFRAKEKHRLQIIDALLKETKIEVPHVLIQSELEKMLGQFKDDVARVGLTWPDYLKSIKKTEEEIKTEWHSKAVDRARAELIVMKVSEKEKIEPDEKEVEHEATHLLEHYPEADPIRARIYIYTQMRNEKVFEYLENLSKDSAE